MKPTKYYELMQKEQRYKDTYNPLQALFQQDGMLKSLEEDIKKQEIEKIIDEELNEEFRIGGHPDYDYLIDQIKSNDHFLDDSFREKDVKMCSLFIDLTNFTKRALFISEESGETIEEIADLKQKAISTWIKLARYYQGHIHSITGDGLMVLFGGKQLEDQDEWTIGARAFLLSLRVLESTDILNNHLKETLAKKGLETTNIHNLLDIKVGLEYSPNTLMNGQGVIVNTVAVGEVKATSFEVDFSAKLLGYYKDAKSKLDVNPKYGRLVMLGEKFIELIEFKEDVKICKLDQVYKKRMFGTDQSRTIHYLDCTLYKNNTVSLDQVAKMCNVYASYEEVTNQNIKVLKEGEKIQHG
ncbi:hypothetical protein [Exiguobacterium sp. s95]|uniref:hypothetical protein n=1 Tax=Exiguobacterium sp. s95 TaxID=2751211 RepID=UPI001BE69908|nr:hypothetical protein [Exiguobacterium sp. s95]